MRLKAVLIITWIFSGHVYESQWPMDDMADCMENASAIDANQAIKIECKVTRR
jgi:hypothetical protein